MRVLHLRDSPWIDGPGRTIIETAASIDPAVISYHLGILAPVTSTRHPMVIEAIARRLPYTVIGDSGGLDRNAIHQIRQIIDYEKIDVVHTSDPRSNLLAVIALGLRARPKLVATTHGWIANSFRRKLMRALDKLILRRFDRVILVSRAMSTLLPKWWIPRSRVVVLHNALLVGSYGNGVVRIPASTDRVVRMLGVGRLSPEKGFDLLLRALAEVVSEPIRYELVIAGIGPMEDALRDLALRLGISDRVKFAGFVADMPKLYANCDVVIQSSLTEGMPNVLLEAALLQVPIIATDVGGSAELVDHNITGVLIPAGSIPGLVSAMRRFASDRQSFDKMAGQARDRVIKEFSFDVRTRRLTDLYLEMLGR